MGWLGSGGGGAPNTGLRVGGYSGTNSSGKPVTSWQGSGGGIATEQMPGYTPPKAPALSPGDQHTIDSFKTLDPGMRLQALQHLAGAANKGDSVAAQRFSLLKPLQQQNLPLNPQQVQQKYQDNSMGGKVYRFDQGMNRTNQTAKNLVSGGAELGTNLLSGSLGQSAGEVTNRSSGKPVVTQAGHTNDQTEAAAPVLGKYAAALIPTNTATDAQARAENNAKAPNVPLTLKQRLLTEGNANVATNAAIPGAFHQGGKLIGAAGRAAGKLAAPVSDASKVNLTNAVLAHSGASKPEVPVLAEGPKQLALPSGKPTSPPIETATKTEQVPPKPVPIQPYTAPVHPAQEVVDTLAKEHADTLKGIHDQSGGVTILRDDSGTGGPTYKRMSSNDPFYQQYYADHGSPPTKAAWLEEAHRQLSSGNTPEAGMYRDAKEAAVQGNAEHLAAHAAAHNNIFQAKVNDVAKTFGGTEDHVLAGPPKEAERIAEKANTDYSGDVTRVKDASRASLVLHHPDDLPAYIDAIKQHFSVVGEPKHLVTDNGYEDWKVNVRAPGGHVAEIKIASPEMLKAGEESHPYYEKARTGTETPADLEAMNHLFSEAKNSELKRLNSGSDTGRPKVMALSADQRLPKALTAEKVPSGSSDTVTGTSSTSKNLGNLSATEKAPSSTNVAQDGAKVNEGDLYSRGAVGHDVGNDVLGTPGGKEGKMIGNVRERTDLAPEIKGAVEDSYKVRGVQGLVDHADNYIQEHGLDAATNEAHNALAEPTGHISDQTVVAVNKVVHALSDAGRYDEATHLTNSVFEHVRESGRVINAVKTWYQDNPDVLRHTAETTVDKAFKAAGKEAPAEIKTMIRTETEKIKTIKDPAEKQVAVDKLTKTVNRSLPTHWWDKTFVLWRTGLLTGPQTVTKVLASHSVLNGLEAAKDPLATALDKTISTVFNKPRTTTSTLRGSLSGAVKGTKAGAKLLIHNEDTPGTGTLRGTETKMGQPEVNFKTGFLGKLGKPGQAVGGFLNQYVEKVTNTHAVMPKAFYTSAAENDLYKQAGAEAANRKLTGTAKQQFINDFVKNPTDAARAESTHAGQMATFQQKTLAGKEAAKLQSVLGGRVLAPFAHIASAILTDAANYSPVGLLKAPIEAVMEKGEAGWTPQVQKHFVEGMSRAVVGTGILYAGMKLYKAGVVTLDQPTDPKTSAQWKQLGKQPNSILLNGQWRQLASLGPAAIVMAMGAYAQSANDQVGNKTNTALAAVAGALKSLSNQSFLSGISGATGAINNPQMEAKSFVKNEASSIVPIGVGTVAKAFDPLARQTNTVGDAILSKIPGAREKLLLPQTDAQGNTIKRQGGVVTNLLDPTRPQDSNTNASPLNQELQRLSTQGITASPQVEKTITIHGAKIQLTPQQSTQRQKDVGPLMQRMLTQEINQSDYKGLSDQNKGSVLAKVIADVNRAENVKLIKQMQPNAFPKAYKGMTQAQKNIYNTGLTTKDYAYKKAHGG